MAVRKQLFAPGDVVKIVPVGGVFRSRFLEDEFRRRLDAEESTSVVQPKFEPVIGALFRAYQLAGSDAQTALLSQARLKRSPLRSPHYRRYSWDAQTRPRSQGSCRDHPQCQR